LKPEVYQDYEDGVEQVINREVDKYRNGGLSFKHTVKFDIDGGDLTNLTVFSASDNSIRASIDSGIRSISLEAPFMGPYALMSEEVLDLNLKWSSEYILLQQREKKSFLIGDYFEDKRVFLDYVERHHKEVGVYKFEVKSKELNGKTYKDVYAVGFTNRGPTYSLYSLALPGLGSAMVSYGKKGWGRMASFMVCSVLSFATYTYSQDQYRLYQSATRQSLINEYYDNANSANQTAIMLGGVAASIYIYDVFWALNRGVKNKRISDGINSSLRGKPEKLKYAKLRL
jgi:hypothetical protein